MITLKLHMTSCSDEQFIHHKISMFSYAVIHTYNAVELVEDKSFEKFLSNKFKLNAIEYDSVVSKAKAIRSSEDSNRKNKEDRIEYLKEKLSKEKVPSKRYKIWKKINYLECHLEKKCSFGTKDLQRRLTREYNKAERNEEKIAKLSKQFKDKRLMPFFIVGEANQKGNRFFDLSKLFEGKISYKPFKGKRIELTFKVTKRMFVKLYKLSDLAERKEISVSVSIGNDSVYLTFDEQILSGFAFDGKEYRRELKEAYNNLVFDEEKELKKKEIKKKYYDEQKERMMVGKVKGRCMGIDLNPTKIGFSIIQEDLAKECGYKILKCGYFDLSLLSKKLKVSSNHSMQKKQNNKRTYELSIVIKSLIDMALHYGCEIFAMEDLNFKVDSDDKSKESNRQIKNIWKREYIVNLIRRRCNENGIELREVNPCYSSFIGNIQHKFEDSTNASIEISRRGLVRFIKGSSIYPHISEADLYTVDSLFEGVAISSTVANWKDIYQLSQDQFASQADFEHRWRARLDCLPKGEYEKRSLNTYKSKVKLITFTNLY